jgi:hypothetical protein
VGERKEGPLQDERREGKVKEGQLDKKRRKEVEEVEERRKGKGKG